VLWAWESPQDLRFLNHGEGVAFLAGEFWVEGEDTRWIPRRNPLLVNPGTPLMAVLRIESRQARWAPPQREACLKRALALLALPQVQGLQIDFDAKESERESYAAILHDLRARLPRDRPLSITALASWCLADPWLKAHEAAVDETVPMLFRMGREGDRVRKNLEQGQEFMVNSARHSYGISTDEPLPRLRSGRRCYVFHPGPWTPQAWEAMRGRLPR